MKAFRFGDESISPSVLSVGNDPKLLPPVLQVFVLVPEGNVERLVLLETFEAEEAIRMINQT